MIDTDGSGTKAGPDLSGLVYELLDAHLDTMKLADGVADDGVADSDLWAAHLDYLRGLQRVGREALAQL